MKFLKRAAASATALALMATTASAQDGIGGMATSIEENLRPFLSLIMIAAFLGGIFFAVQAILKMKDAKENPRDNPPGTIALNWFAAIFLAFLGGGIVMIQSTLGVGNQILGGQQSVTYGP